LSDGRVSEFLDRVASFAEAYPQIQAWASDRDAPLLAALAGALERGDEAFRLEPGLREALLRCIDDAAITAVVRRIRTGAPETDGFLQLLESRRGRGRRMARLASRLGDALSAVQLEALVRGPQACSRELWVMLGQEALLRDKLSPELAQVLTPLMAEHPLGWLPLQRDELEVELDLPSYTEEGGGALGMPFGPGRQGSSPVVVGPWAGATNLHREVTTPDDAERITAAVGNWEEESNGRSEGRVFAVDDAWTVALDALLALGLKSLEGGNRRNLHVHPIGADEAIRTLYGAAANGGAYSSGLGAAYGRREAWRSAGALAGVPEGTSFGGTAAAVSACRWYWFECENNWFWQVAWDFGLLAVRAGGQSLAVLAATDTD